MQTNGRDKVVHYWSAEVHDHQLEIAKFVPNSEISQAEWLPIKAALGKLSYSHDREIVQRLRERIKAGTARTFGVIVLRHGKAVPPGAWDGPDATRPLLHRGSDQAKAIAAGLAAFAPERIISSTAARCLATVAPLAAATNLPVKEDAGISQDAYEYGQSAVQRIVSKRLKQRQTVVLCSHGPVIPEIIAEVAQELDADESGLRHAGMLSTADYSVLHISLKNPQLVAVETHSPPQ
jgi:8-oxo-dGTP diphosphatase